MNAPSIHAARAGAWALLLVVVVDLAVDLGFGFVQFQALRSRGDFAGDGWLDSVGWLDWIGWLDWLGEGVLPLQLLLVALVAVALVRLRRGTEDPVARNLFVGAVVAWSLRAATTLTMHLVGLLGDYDAWTGAFDRMQLGSMAADRAALGLVLAGIFRVRRGWGRAAGAAWTTAVAIFALRSVYLLASLLEWFGPREVETDGFLRRLLVVYGLGAAELVALAAALVAFGRAAPPEPEANRWTAAAAGLDTYFRAVVTRVTVLLVGVALIVMLGLGRAPASTRSAVLLGVLALQLPVAIAQLAGLTCYADAPTRIARGALWTALVVVGLGLVSECMVFAAVVAVVWNGPAAWGSRAPSASMLRDIAAAGQVLGFIAAIGLLASLRGGAVSLGAPLLQARAERLLVALVAAAVVLAGLVYGGGEALARSPWLVLGLGLVGLAFGVTVFIGWLRLIEGVARAMRQRAAGQ